MSLRINTNIPAMTALLNLSNTDDEMSTAITRLSTGLRINTAADDPAGLIISEGMRAQINGINQAVSNTQDAINMSKTAEAALNEVSTLLNDSYSLAVQSANTAIRLRRKPTKLSFDRSSTRSIESRSKPPSERRSCWTARRACPPM